MTKTYDLTDNEFRAALVFVKSCLHGMGGARPSDLADDTYTWINLTDLTEAGWSKHEAAGTMSALMGKGVIAENGPGEWILEDAAWQWLDTVWDQAA